MFQIIDDSQMDCGTYKSLTAAKKAARNFRKSFKSNFFIKDLELGLVLFKFIYKGN